MGFINCPYCNDKIEICHDDGFGYEEGVKHQYECGACNRGFIFYTEISIDYTAYKADCLNDGVHHWRPSGSYPEFTRNMRCQICGTQRQPTQDERIEFDIPTYEEYLHQTANKKA